MTGITDKYYEDIIYDVNTDKAEAFDKFFPQKERIEGTPTQRRFEEVFAMQKDYKPIKNISLICVPIRCMKISKTYIIHVSRYLSNVHRNNKWKLIRTRLTNFWLSRKKMYFLDLSLIGNLTPII